MPGSHSHPLARNAARRTVKPINFICTAPEAKRVTLIGDFNDWDPNAHPLKRHVDGSWSLQVTLGHGHHHYQFLIDGKATLDPRAQGIARNEQNEKVSLLAVS
jgi:1,4-alpha-glucan branching enzyme